MTNKKTVTTEESKRLAKLMADMNKKGNKKDDLSTTFLGEFPDTHPSISSGILQLDKELGIGGYPLGRITEVYGRESSGKTTLVLAAVAEAQRANKLCAFVDAEFSMNKAFATRLNVDAKNLVLVQPESGEDAFTKIEQMLESKLFSIIILDSLAALVPQAELNGEMDDAQVGLQARVINKGLRKISTVLKESDTALIVLNQLRDNIGAVGFGAPLSKTPGGRAMKFYASVRMSVVPIKTLKDKDGLPNGNTVRLVIEKNKMSSPKRTLDVTLRFTSGFSNESSIISEALEYKLIKKSGSFFSSPEGYFDGNIQGNDALEQFLVDNFEVKESLLNAIRDIYAQEDSQKVHIDTDDEGDFYE